MAPLSTFVEFVALQVPLNEVMRNPLQDRRAIKQETVAIWSPIHPKPNKMGSWTRRTLFMSGLIFGVTLFPIFVLLLQNFSQQVAWGTYRWYSTHGDCIKSTSEQGELVDLAEQATKALRKLGIPAPVCYGTLFGVLRYHDLLPWDNNVDFCVMNEYLRNVSFGDMQDAFAREGIILHEFSYSVGSYRMQRGSVDGHINVFINCTHIVPLIYPDWNVPIKPGDEMMHWACAYSIASAIGKYTHDINRPFPTRLLTPPFPKQRLAYTVIEVPNESFEIQKYLFPDDWWLEVKPLGCL